MSKERDEMDDKILMTIAGIAFSAGLFITVVGIFLDSIGCIKYDHFIGNIIKIGFGLIIAGVVLRAAK